MASRLAVLIRVVGAMVFLVGSMVWTSRLDFSPEAALQEQLGTRLTEVSNQTVTDLTGACRQVEAPGGWILFVLNAQIISDDGYRTYFETADETNGLWVEYEPGLLRLGLGRGSNSSEPSMSIPIRVARRSENAVVVIGVSRDETRVLTNGVDKRKAWPGTFAQAWQCGVVQVGVDDKELSQGNACNGCDAKLRFATGVSENELTELLDSLSNVQRFNQRRTLGSALTLLGALLTLFAPRVIAYRETLRNRLHAQRGDS